MCHSQLVSCLWAAPNPLSLSTSHYRGWKTKHVLSPFFLKLETVSDPVWPMRCKWKSSRGGFIESSFFPHSFQGNPTSKFFWHWKQHLEQKQPFCNYEESSNRNTGMHCENPELMLTVAYVQISYYGRKRIPYSIRSMSAEFFVRIQKHLY